MSANKSKDKESKRIEDPAGRLSENGYFSQSLRQTQIIILEILQRMDACPAVFKRGGYNFRLPPLKVRDLQLDLGKNISFSETLLSGGNVDFDFEIKRAHSLKVRPCLENYSLALKNAINRTIENTLKDYPLVGPPGFEPGTYRL